MYVNRDVVMHLVSNVDDVWDQRRKTVDDFPLPSTRNQYVYSVNFCSDNVPEPAQKLHPFWTFVQSIKYQVNVSEALENRWDRRHKVFHWRMLTGLLIPVIQCCQDSGGSLCRKLAEDGTNQVFKVTFVREVEIREDRRWVGFAQCTNILDHCRTADPLSTCQTLGPSNLLTT